MACGWPDVALFLGGMFAAWAGTVVAAWIFNRPTDVEWDDDFPTPNTPEWDEMDDRRISLIGGHISGTITDAEEREYERLQRLSLEALRKAYPTK